MYILTGFKSEFEKWPSQMWCRACSNEQFMRQHMKYKTILFRKWLTTGRLDTHLAKSMHSHHGTAKSSSFQSPHGHPQLVAGEVACCVVKNSLFSFL